MPRPKRTKVGSSQPTERVTEKKSITSTKTTTQPATVANTRKSSRTTRKTSQGSEAQDENEYVMTGALPEGHAPVQFIPRKEGPKDGVTDVPASKPPAEFTKPAAAQYYRTRVGRSQIYATSSPAPRDAISVVATETVQVTQEIVAATEPEPNLRENDADKENNNYLSDLFDVSPGGKASRTRVAKQVQEQQSAIAVSRRTSVLQPASALRALGTPARESSILALGKFKRRKRQGSIIRQMVEASEIDLGDEFDDELNLDDTDFGLGDFKPDDESTPMHYSTIVPRFPEKVLSSGSRKRKFGDTGVQVVRSPSPLAMPQEPSSESDLPGAGQAHSSISVIADSAPQPIDEVEPSQSSIDSPTTALPNESALLAIPSSSLLSTPPSSPSSEDHNATPHAVNISTLELTSLLPRTRRPRHLPRNAKDTVYDLNSDTTILSDPPASDAGSDTSVPDEPTPVRRGTRRKVPVRAPLVAKRTVPQPRAKSAATKDTAGKSVKAKDTTSKGKTPLRKYGRPREDKENAPSDADDTFGPDQDESTVVQDESTIVEDADRAQSMAKMRDKFAAVDEWEMDYETVDFSNASSPWR
ncbi:hypothetical protein BT63DRAFT_430607 [Microthyrium microscopicum]|uniref:Uncharacterized protein n=1 Tax=Microthyrium microscopicum TaxID=703497 RepID=A0A6A6TUQ5_9PEZI|nr:hypothetical protein BT63DRAFT_430607 [Microthyrium microscopicum]